MNRSESIDALAVALAKAQSKIEGAIRDKTNPAFRSKYADLGACWDAVREPLSSNGLSIVQFPRTTDAGMVEVESMLLHSSGQFLSDVFAIPVSKRDAHGYMSACTYARRGGLMAIAGIAPVDDDTNSAVGVAVAGGIDPIHAAKEEILAQRRADGGEQRSQYEVEKARKAAKGNGDGLEKAGVWVTKAIGDIGNMAHGVEISEWWRVNSPAIDRLHEGYPDEYERLCIAIDERRDQVPSVTQAG